ncbi:hypothetical protein IEQ34_003420 [Dendrobium chrysotoxum]|uniref:C2H2-type domain-containing protein n=1 Tax=Dendrobium chrysotoxum TaxID=161865 RepID=A0AAV7HHL4_DENCH|nr:hypothetical protein IEQ34_003420 [Dendrobium chrysotoxum]
MALVLNYFPNLCDHCKTLCHSKNECFHLHLHLHLRKSVPIKPRIVEDNVNLVPPCQPVGLINVSENVTNPVYNNIPNGINSNPSSSLNKLISPDDSLNKLKGGDKGKQVFNEDPSEGSRGLTPSANSVSNWEGDINSFNKGYSYINIDKFGDLNLVNVAKDKGIHNIFFYLFWSLWLNLLSLSLIKGLHFVVVYVLRLCFNGWFGFSLLAIIRVVVWAYAIICIVPSLVTQNDANAIAIISSTYMQNDYVSNDINLLTHNSSIPLIEHEVDIGPNIVIQLPIEEGGRNLEDGEIVTIVHSSSLDKCNVELVERENGFLEDDGMFIEGDCPQMTAIRDHPSGSKNFTSSYYNSDVFTDTEDMNITAKNFTRDDNDLSFFKVRSKRGRKPKSISL